MARLDELGVRSNEELAIVEASVDVLLSHPFSERERNMGVRLARLTIALSNRPRHRVSTDTVIAEATTT